MPQRPDDPSLLRPTDRARRAVRRAQLALAGLALVLALPAGAAVQSDELERSRLAAVTLTPVQAELLEPAAFGTQGAVVGAPARVTARWTGPDGTERTDRLWAEPGLPRGATIPVWVDAGGTVAAPPGTAAGAEVSGWITALGVTVSLWGALIGLGMLARRALDATDDRRWTAEWALVEPRWSGRVPP